MSLLDRAWELQHRIGPRLSHWFYKKIGVRFFVGMLTVSFLCYAVMVILYFQVFEPVDFFTTQRIPFYLNPVVIVLFCGIVFLLLILEKKQII